jgi:Fic family protein
MAIEGIELLPPKVSTKEALDLYKKVADIKSAIGRLNAELNHSIIDKNIIQIFSLQESVQSTRIEGTQVTFADMIEQATNEKKSKEVIEVLNYRKALRRGIELLKAGNPISSKMIRELHSILMSGETRGTTSASGEFRKVQNFIGPDKKIENATYIPISAEKISDYMTNLEYYINGEVHSSFPTFDEYEEYEVFDQNVDTLIKTAIIHAQFESIHPFLDGNGRLGRILIILCFMMDDLINEPVFFISEELEKERLRYYNRLNGVRGDNPDWITGLTFSYLQVREWQIAYLRNLKILKI